VLTTRIKPFDGTILSSGVTGTRRGSKFNWRSKTMKILRFCIIVLGLIFAAGILWLYAHHLLFYRQTVLEAPIRFEEGFSLNREFTVDTPQSYWVAIQYDEIFRSTVEVPTPRDEFTAEF
jgi:hypothetical protein